MIDANFRYVKMIVGVLHGIEIKFADSYKMFRLLFIGCEPLMRTDGGHHRKWQMASIIRFFITYSIDQSNKSHNAPVPYPTMHYSKQKSAY